MRQIHFPKISRFLEKYCDGIYEIMITDFVLVLWKVYKPGWWFSLSLFNVIILLFRLLVSLAFSIVTLSTISWIPFLGRNQVLVFQSYSQNFPLDDFLVSASLFGIRKFSLATYIDYMEQVLVLRRYAYEICLSVSDRLPMLIVLFRHLQYFEL